MLPFSANKLNVLHDELHLFHSYEAFLGIVISCWVISWKKWKFVVHIIAKQVTLHVLHWTGAYLKSKKKRSCKTWKKTFFIIIYVNLSLSTLWLLKLSLNALEEIGTSLIVSLKLEVRVVLPFRNLTSTTFLSCSLNLFLFGRLWLTGHNSLKLERKSILTHSYNF